jgi:DNA-directed RNA polymerase specialized sigma24 family protein
MNPQFDSPLELSSDLEWLLQNGKASRVALAHFLVSEFYADAVRLSWAILEDIDQAHQTVIQAFTAALVNQYRFRVGQNARIWLYRFVIQSIRNAITAQKGSRDLIAAEELASEPGIAGLPLGLDEQDKWALFVSVLLGWQPLECAELIGVEVTRVERLLDTIHLAASQLFSSVHSYYLVNTLERTLSNRYPPQSLSEDQQAEIAARLVRAAEQRTAQNLRLIRFWEIFSIAVGVIVVTGLILWFNQALPDISPPGAVKTPTAPVLRVTRVVLIPITATAEGITRFQKDDTVPPAATELPSLPPPLDANSTPAEVMQRLTSSQSLWSTIWVDAQLTLNGPAGYIGPPDVTYEQAWVDRSGKRSIELSGKSSSYPDWVYAASGNAASQIDRQLSQPQHSPSSQLLKSESLRAMLFPLNSDWLSSAENLVIGHTTRYIGRDTLLVSVMNASDFLQAQLWVDVETGVILRELRYSGDPSQTQTANFSITKISYNDNFSDALFDPQARLDAGFSADPGGLAGKSKNQLVPDENSPAHQAFAAALAPDGFNPAQSQLFFRFPETFNTGAASAEVDVLAGAYLLGKARLGNPWTAMCVRSPGGQKIAYVSQPANTASGDASLHWFDLQNVSEDHLVSEDLAVDNFAFSYNGQELAFFGRQAGQGRGAVYIDDLQSGALQRLLDRNSANSLVWSPDGSYLAMTSAPSMFGTQDALVVDVQDGEIVAQDRYNWQGDFSLDPLSPNWPTFNWRTPKGTPVKFPVSMGGLEACVLPPN